MSKSQANWMSIGDAAKHLGVSRDTLRRWEKAGKIKPVRSPTNRRYYTKKILDNALKAKKEKRTLAKPTKSLRIGKTGKMLLVGGASLAFGAILALLVLIFLAG
jgi:excisionase family DNA binding protein